jgi:hypothetical protein
MKAYHILSCIMLASSFIVAPHQGSASSKPEYEWTKVNLEAPFCARDGLGVLSYKGKLWVIGGWNPDDKENAPLICTNDVWSSVDGERWELEKPNSYIDRSFDAAKDWEGRHTAGYVVFRDRMWIVGGDCNQGHYMSDVWSSSNGREWELANPGKPAPWGPRALHHTLVFKNKIWVIGGQTMPLFAAGEDKLYRDIWASSDGVNWTEVVPEEPFWSARGMIGGNAIFKDRIWILGGGTYDTPDRPTRDFYNDVWSSADGMKWECHTRNAPWAPRQYHEVAVFDGKLWVLEGYGSPDPGRVPAENRNDVWYSEDGVHWKEVPNTPWAKRHAAGIAVFDDALWIVAGNNMTSDVWKLSPATAPVVMRQSRGSKPLLSKEE